MTSKPSKSLRRWASVKSSAPTDPPRKKTTIRSQLPAHGTRDSPRVTGSLRTASRDAVIAGRHDRDGSRSRPVRRLTNAAERCPRHNPRELVRIVEARVNE